MVRTSPPGRFAICAAAFVLGAASLAAQTPRAAAPALVPASFTKVTDSLGFSWDVNSSGGIARGSNCFLSAFTLMIDGENMMAQSAMMTVDGQEYFFTGNANGISFSRRVRVDLKDSYCRFIETLTNTSGEFRNFPFAIRVRLGGRLQANGQDSGDREFPFDAKDAGIIIGGSPAATPPRPAFAWMLASPGAKMRPTVRIDQSTYITATYPVVLAPGGSVSFVHAGAQRTLGSKLTADEHARLFAPMTSARLLAGLSAKERKEFANFTPPAEDESAAGPGLAALQTMLEAAGITRDKADALMVEPGAVMTGKITGSDLAIATEFGKAKVAFADIAAIAGGGGVGRPPRIFLRNGEILSGEIAAEKFAMLAGGISLEIDLALVHLLSLAKEPADGTLPADAVALLTTQGGDCLALAHEGTSAIEVATPWGAFRVPVAEITSLATVRDPVPAQRLTLADGSRVPVMLRSGDWEIATTRFGTARIAMQSVREIRGARAKATPPAGKSNEPAADFARCELPGEHRLAGVIDLPEIHLVSAKHTTALDPKTIARLDREPGDDGAAIVKVKLFEGQEISGRLAESILPIRSADRVWRVPAAHILAVAIPPRAKPKDEPPKASPCEDNVTAPTNVAPAPPAPKLIL